MNQERNFEPSYDKNIVDSLVGYDPASLESLTKRVGGYVASHVTENFDKVAFIEALSDTDMPERELQYMYELLRLEYTPGSPTKTYTFEDIEQLIGDK